MKPSRPFAVAFLTRSITGIVASAPQFPHDEQDLGEHFNRHTHCSKIGVRTALLLQRKVTSPDLIPQTTLGSSVETDGIGLHTGVRVQVRLLPAPPDTGYVFRRTDLGGFEIPATVESVANCGYATTLMRTGVMLSTVEHLLAALRGSGIDNVFIEVDNLEVPILDGSAEVFADMIERAGTVAQPLARRALLVRERVTYEQGNRRISVEPADSYQIDCLIDFHHPMIGVQRFAVELNNGTFSREIAPARTFGFTDEIEELQRSNLIRGGSLDNAIVLTPDGMLNQTGLRFRDEFVRHKILDIVGDLALLGMPILGRVTAERSGHIMHAGLMSKLLRIRSAWDIVDMPQTSQVIEPLTVVSAPGTHKGNQRSGRNS